MLGYPSKEAKLEKKSSSAGGRSTNLGEQSIILAI